MANAEDDLYKQWKRITLGTAADSGQYSVWDYPIREQYNHMLQVELQSCRVTDTMVMAFTIIRSSTGLAWCRLHKKDLTWLSSTPR